MGIADLTERQQQVWDCRHSASPPKPLDQVARELDLNPMTARSTYQLAREKLGLVGSANTGIGNLTETRHPELAAAAFGDLSAAQQQVIRIAEDLDLPYATIQQLQKRLARDYVPLERALGEVEKKDLRELFASVSWRVLSRVTDEDIEKASLRDKLVAAAIATDKIQVLDGEPTQILSVKELENLDGLAGLLKVEIERRNQQPLTDPQTLEVTLPPGEPPP